MSFESILPLLPLLSFHVISPVVFIAYVLLSMKCRLRILRIPGILCRRHLLAPRFCRKGIPSMRTTMSEELRCEKGRL